MNTSVIEGHCNQCGKIWTLEKEQGVCQWCGNLASCQTRRTQALRNFKSRSNHKRRQVKIYSNGYGHLQGEWLTYYKVAEKFESKSVPSDREDLRHNIICRLAEIAKSRPLTLPACYRVASYVVREYWRNHFKLTAGLDCSNCSTKQRRNCRNHWSYRDCPKAIKLESLERGITDENGNITEYGEMIADDHTLDLEAWLDAKEWLLKCPKRLIDIGKAIQNGVQLDGAARKYLYKMRRREQKKLF